MQNGALGPDGLSYQMICHLHQSTSVFRLVLFNRIWVEGIFPCIWQQPLIISIPDNNIIILTSIIFSHSLIDPLAGKKSTSRHLLVFGFLCYKHLTLWWVPSHVDIQSNELIAKAVFHAATFNLVDTTSLTPSYWEISLIMISTYNLNRATVIVGRNFGHIFFYPNYLA